MALSGAEVVDVDVIGWVAWRGGGGDWPGHCLDSGRTG